MLAWEDHPKIVGPDIHNRAVYGSALTFVGIKRRTCQCKPLASRDIRHAILFGVDRLHKITNADYLRGAIRHEILGCLDKCLRSEKT